MRRILVVSIAVLLLAAVAAPAGAITNGLPDGDDHPYVGLLVFDVDGAPAWRCSGALISPTVVLTAGHCTDGATGARIWFDEDVQTNAEYPFGGATSTEGTPHTHPDFCIGCGSGLPDFAFRDIGVVVLDEPVDVGGFAELPDAGMVDALPGRASLMLVGYGVQEQTRGGGPPAWTGLRIRLQAQTRLVSGDFVHSSEFVRLTANPGQGKGGTCFGDSGGPVLDGDTAVAVNSYVTNSNCAGVTYSSRVDIPAVLDWIEGFTG